MLLLIFFLNLLIGGQNRAPMQGLNKEAREILQQAFIFSGFSPAK